MLSPDALRFITDELWAFAPASTATSFHLTISCYIQFLSNSTRFFRRGLATSIKSIFNSKADILFHFPTF
ncbi:hypothetical protein B0H14DRAFT_3886549 [Mycena olivaceomarginata]|nr:hypothetical protein B0H14DRAFT_3886549 [Mycena olivaceomarginata]